MRFNSHKTLWIGLGLWGLSLCGTASALQINPGVRVVSVQPGEVQQIQYEITNDGDHAVGFDFSFREAYRTKENSNLKVEDWLKPKFKTIQVNAKSKTQIPFEIRLPKTATGEVGALLTFTQKANVSGEKEESMGMQIVPSMTIALYVRVAGTIKGNAEIQTLTIDQSPARASQPAFVHVKAEFVNHGNVHLRPGGIAKIYKQGQKESTMEIPFEEGWPTMPESSFEYPAQSSGTLPAGKYRIDVLMSVESTQLEQSRNFSVGSDGKISYENAK
jgi:multidrug efflux pump subunit AcrA (membrane-fusion protein)